MYRYRVLITLLLAALLIGSCVPGVPSSEAPTIVPAVGPSTAPAVSTPSVADTDPGNDQQIVIGFGAAERRRTILEPLIDAFNTQNLGFRVQFVPLNSTQHPTLREAVNAADVVLGYSVTPAEINTGLIRELTPFADADPTFETDDFYAGALTAARQDDRLYLLPLTLSVPMLDYNTDLWAERGLQTPKPDWSWTDLLDAATRIAEQQRNTVDVYGLRDPGGTLTLRAALGRAGVDLSTSPQEVPLDRQEIVEVFIEVQDLAQRGVIATAQAGPAGDDAALIRMGQLGMWPAERTEAAQHDGQLPIPVGRVPYPTQDSPTGVVLAGAVMSAGTQHPEQAWRWLSFLSRQPILPPSNSASSNILVPARRSAAGLSNAWLGLDAETRLAIKAALDRPLLSYNLRADNHLVMASLERALAAVLNDDRPPAEALREAQAKLQGQATPVTASVAGKRASSPIVVATPVPTRSAENVVRIKFLEENLFGNVWGEPVVEAFRREYPQIELEIFDYSEPTHSTLTEAAKASDCFAWNSPPDPSEVMATLDLQPLIDADATFPRNDYWPAALQPFQQDGRLSGLPFTLSFPVLYYNQALFDEAGLPYPTSDWTLSDLLATAERLTDITGSTKQYGLLTAGSVDLALFLDQNQIALTTGSGATLLPQYTDPTVVSALEQFVDVMKKVTPFQGKTIFASPTEAMQVVDIQQGGMFFGSDPLSWIPSQVPDARFGVVMMRNIPPAPYIQPPGLFISAQTEHPEACWTWIKFLSNTD